MFGLFKKPEPKMPSLTEKEMFEKELDYLCQKAVENPYSAVLILINLIYKTENYNLYKFIQNEIEDTINYKLDSYQLEDFKIKCRQVKNLEELNQEYKNILSGIEKLLLDQCNSSEIEEEYKYMKFCRSYDYKNLNDCFVIKCIEEEEERNQESYQLKLSIQKAEDRKQEILNELKNMD